MKLHMVLDVRKVERYTLSHEIESLDKDQVYEIAKAFLDAYVGTIDYEGENLADAVEEIKYVFSNGYGKYSSEYSGSIIINGQIASILLAVSNQNKIFIPYVVTTKKESGKGLAEQLLRSCINKAIFNKIEIIELYVTKGNYKAENLYKKNGFVESE